MFKNLTINLLLLALLHVGYVEGTIEKVEANDEQQITTAPHIQKVVKPITFALRMLNTSRCTAKGNI